MANDDQVASDQSAESNEDALQGEIVQDLPTASPDSTPTVVEEGGAQVVLNLEGLIKNHISSIERLEEEYKKHKEMLDDIFANDTTYQQHLETAKEATKIKTATKQQILKQPQVADLSNKVKALKSEMGELEGALSDYLGEYQRLSGLTEIEGEDGQIRQIVYVAKLVKKTF